MQDHSSPPPLSDAEIQALIAAYLDGETDAEKTARLQALLNQYPQYMDEFLRQQSLKSAVTALPHQSQPSAPLDSLWTRIASQLDEDGAVTPEHYDEEFVSAYYDGEVSSDDPAFEQFERQLFNNVEANRLLADFGDVSELVRQHAYRLEESCTLDIASQVVALYQQESVTAETTQVAAPLSQDEPDKELPLDPMIEAVSALFDQELTPRETIQYNGLVENSDEYRLLLGQFNALSEHIQRVSEQIQAQAPELWPVVAEELAKTLESQPARSNVLKFSSVKWMSVPVAAAAVLLLVSVPLFRAGVPSPAPLQAQEAERAKSYELASLPAPAGDAPLQRVVFKDDGGVTPTAVSDDAAPARVATTVSPAYARPQVAAAAASVPSSEEYLFETLDNPEADGEMPLLLGTEQ